MSATLQELVKMCSIVPHIQVSELARWFGESAICRECEGTGMCDCSCDHGHSIEHDCEECGGDGYNLNGDYAEFPIKGTQLGLFNPEYKGRVYMVFNLPRQNGVVVTEEFLHGAKQIAEKEKLVQ